MIETKREINIKEISLSEPKETIKPFFDPMDYLKEKDLMRVEKLRTIGFSSILTDSVRFKDFFLLKILLPSEFEQIKTSDINFEKVYERVQDLQRGNTWHGAVELLSSLFLAFPEKRNHEAVNDRLVRKTLSRASTERKWDWSIFLDTFIQLKILDPEKSKEVKQDEGTLNEIFKYHISVNDTDRYITRAAKMRIAFPNHYKLFAPTNDDWTQIDTFLKDREHFNLDDMTSLKPIRKYLKSLADAAILAADDVKLTKERGLEINPKKSLSVHEAQILPISRRF
jgi:hypothetical protein